MADEQGRRYYDRPGSSEAHHYDSGRPSSSVEHMDTAPPPPQLALEQLRNTTTNVSSGKSLADFLTDVKAITPVIPDSVAQYYMQKNGLNSQDPRIIRLISVATQKFISDIALDTMQNARMQGLGQVRKGSREPRFVLNTELLEPVLEEYGIPFHRPSFYH